MTNNCLSCQELEDALVEVLEEALKEDTEIILISDSGTTTLSNNAYGKAFNLLDKRGRFLPREEKAEEEGLVRQGYAPIAEPSFRVFEEEEKEMNKIEDPPKIGLIRAMYGIFPEINTVNKERMKKLSSSITMEDCKVSILKFNDGAGNIKIEGALDFNYDIRELS